MKISFNKDIQIIGVICMCACPYVCVVMEGLNVGVGLVRRIEVRG